MSAVEQSDSVIHKHMYILIFFFILFHYSLLQDIEYSSLCYRVNPCCLSTLYVVVCSVNPILPMYPSSPFLFGSHKFVFCVGASLSAL